MADLGFYKKHLNLSSVDEICKALTDTLIKTNYTYDFFVNWDKVINHTEKYKYQLALLQSMNNSKNPAKDFRELIVKYPEVIRVIPVLLACRDGLLKVLNSLENDLKYKSYDFNKSSYDNKEVDDIVHFARETRLLEMLCTMDSATDYLLGVEVGLDTNARKNRSGSFLERMVTEILKELSVKNPNLVFVEQKTFGFVERKYNIKIPVALKDRKFDYVVINRGQPTNIEVNFYSGTGSKPSEIVSSYSDRNRELKSAGWKLVWLTDGQGWKKMQSPLHVGIDNIDYVINANLLRQGLLEKIIT